VKEGGGGEGKCARERALGLLLLLCHLTGYDATALDKLVCEKTTLKKKKSVVWYRQARTCSLALEHKL